MCEGLRNILVHVVNNLGRFLYKPLLVVLVVKITNLEFVGAAVAQL